MASPASPLGGLIGAALDPTVQSLEQQAQLLADQLKAVLILLVIELAILIVLVAIIGRKV